MRPTSLILGAVSVAALALSGCAATSADSGNDLVRVVASTDVYGDVAAQIGGDFVDVTSIIDDPSQDPHSFEGDARIQLALSNSDLVIENGGGYDDFVDTLLDGVDNGDVEVLNVTDISGYDQDPADGEFNEHLWYDFPTVEKLANEIADTLSGLDASHADSFRSNADAFIESLHELEATAAGLKASHDGTGVAITEPVPLYLLEASGLVNETPDAFSEAIEEGTDVSPAVLNETLDLFSAGTVALLAYNEQTTSAETEQVEAAAEAAGVAVVPLTETLPEGDDYLGWMTANLDAISAALG